MGYRPGNRAEIFEYRGKGIQTNVRVKPLGIDRIGRTRNNQGKVRIRNL